MTDPVLGLIDRYRPRGVLVDTNVLLLHFVGGFDREKIPIFKRTQQFTAQDHELLVRLLARFVRVVTTPNILSEVNSLSGQMGEPMKTKYFEQFARGIDTLDEQYVRSADAAEIEQFPKLGLTDSGIMLLAKGNFLVLTDDLRLAYSLEQIGIDVLNFNHIRYLAFN
ncbi:MAG: PIN domain-containing protein [Planctomycetota bacterium]